MSDFEFSSTVETKPKRGASASSGRQAPAPKPPAKMAQADIPEAVNEELKEAEDEKPQYDPEELAKIFDEIIFSGEYSEEVTIRNKLKVRFRTRSAEEIEQISLLIDATTANLVATLTEKRSILNLQYALQVFNGRDLRTMSNEDKAKFIKKLPGPIVGALLKALNDFDMKVYAACQEGEENF